jgi:hypothetical protein
MKSGESQDFLFQLLASLLKEGDSVPTLSDERPANLRVLCARIMFTEATGLLTHGVGRSGRCVYLWLERAERLANR